MLILYHFRIDLPAGRAPAASGLGFGLFSRYRLGIFAFLLLPELGEKALCFFYYLFFLLLLVFPALDYSTGVSAVKGKHR